MTRHFPNWDEDHWGAIEIDGLQDDLEEALAENVRCRKDTASAQKSAQKHRKNSTYWQEQNRVLTNNMLDKIAESNGEL